MATPLIASKLYLPQYRPELVPRSRLIEQLNAGASGRLTLIPEPAGFGKTTLVSAWAKQVERPISWLSLDEEVLGPHEPRLVYAITTGPPAL
ncbi:MAG: hypothetical protein GY759_15290 [Chloroflexi bacterium]|nr:hypothetical protein [Chloroflexota bacterium]